MSDASGDSRWKQTLNLPRTDFPMKGNLTQLEPRILARWDAEETYRTLLAKNTDSPRFVFLDGPPYANGELHAGHALNHVLKDIVVKSRSMAGLLVRLPAGLGLPRAAHRAGGGEAAARAQGGSSARSRGTRSSRPAAPTRSSTSGSRPRSASAWATSPCGTRRTARSTFAYEAQEIRELARIARRGLLYRRKKAVYWCITDQTALAEAEVEYEEHRSPSVYVAFRTEPGTPGLLPERRAESLAAAFPALQGKAVDLRHLDHHPVDAAGQPGHRGASGARVRLLRPRATGGGASPRICSRGSSGRSLPTQLAVKTLAAAGGEVSAAALVEPRRILGYATGKDLEGFAYRHPFIDGRGWWSSPST